MECYKLAIDVYRSKDELYYINETYYFSITPPNSNRKKYFLFYEISPKIIVILPKKQLFPELLFFVLKNSRKQENSISSSQPFFVIFSYLYYFGFLYVPYPYARQFLVVNEADEQRSFDQRLFEEH